MLLRRSFSSSAPPIISSTLGCARKIILNREKALNSLNIEMCTEIKRLLTEWNADPNVNAILMKGAGSKAFCAGGDVKSMYHAIKEKTPLIGIGHPGESSADFFRVEYEMNYMLDQSAIPQVSFWDGFVMGGGVGVSVFGNFRVATENTVFAMPETGIGLFPDVGSTSWLPKIPYGMGQYIALSGGKLKAADLLFAGIATHYMPSDRYGELEDIMVNLPKGDRQGSRQALEVALDAITAEYVGNPNSSLKEEKQVLETNLSVIRRCFEDAKTVEEIVDALSKEDGDDKFVASTLKTLQRVSPTSMKVTLDALQRAEGRSLKECLEMEYRMVQGCMRYHDFAEGVRALLVDRDNKPKWSPDSLAGVTREQVDAFFQPLGDNDLKLP